MLFLFSSLLIVFGVFLLFAGPLASIFTTIVFAIKKKKVLVPVVCIPASFVAGIVVVLIGLSIYEQTDEYKKSPTQEIDEQQVMEEREQNPEKEEMNISEVPPTKEEKTESLEVLQSETEETSSNFSGEEKKEIIFQDIAWETSFPKVDEKLGLWELWNISGESYKECSVDEILLGDYKGIDFEYGGINIISNAFNGEQEIAGYTTSSITLYFAFLPVNGYLSYDEKDTSLYGAQYKFEPTNLEEMYSDLTSKLTSLYGEPEKVKEDTDIWKNKYTYTYWYGANDTELVLRCTDSTNDTTGFYSNEIYISYAWRGGDTLLQNASDAVKKEKADKEKEAHGNDNVGGL